MARIALSLNFEVLDEVLMVTFRGSLQRFRQSASEPVRDLDTVRQFIASPPALAFFDAPWVPVFTAIIFIVHPWLGIFAAFAALIILILALLTDLTSRDSYRSASEHSVNSQRFVENSLRHADVLEAMGMFESFRRRWRDKHDRAVIFQACGGAKLNMLTATSKAFRQVVQVGILGLGAWLVLLQEITPGMMIAASIILGRALAPIEQGISAWRGFVSARQAWQRLNAILATVSTPPTDTRLPRPEGLLEVESVYAAPPGLEQAILRGVSFSLKPGSITGLVGLSGSGKSTLMRLLVGVWPTQRGVVRLDGAAIGDWPASSRLRHIGYLPQEVELFEGSVAENIARLGEPDDEAVIEAARLAHCHEMIMRLPENYDTPMTAGGANLSVGQRRRIALARAMYGDPVLAIMDEADANLDIEGIAALIETIRALAAGNRTVLLTSCNHVVLREAGNVLALNQGTVALTDNNDQSLQHHLNPMYKGQEAK